MIQIKTNCKKLRIWVTEKVFICFQVDIYYQWLFLNKWLSFEFDIFYRHPKKCFSPLEVSLCVWRKIETIRDRRHRKMIGSTEKKFSVEKKTWCCTWKKTQQTRKMYQFLFQIVFCTCFYTLNKVSFLFVDSFFFSWNKVSWTKFKESGRNQSKNQ